MTCSIFFLGGGGSSGRGGGGLIRGWGGGGGVARFGVGGDVGYGGCKARIKGIDKCKLRFCTILRTRVGPMVL